MIKRILVATLVLSLLSGGAAVAQPRQGRDDQNRGEQGRNEQTRGEREGNNRNANNRDRNEQNNRADERNDSRSQQGNPRWSRGERVPDRYRQNDYVVVNWRNYSLSQPPRGYQWVHNDRNDFFLISIINGTVTDTYYRDDRNRNWRESYSRNYTYNDDSYYRECRSSPDPAEIIAGALIGGLFGNTVGRGGGRGGATIAGVIVGGAVGAALTSNLNCDDRSYAYRTYYDGFNAGRPNTTYQWRNPGTDRRGEFRVGSYYNDRSGFRCANYSQTIYIQGRPQEARGVACLQPDGTWAIVS